MMAISRAEMDAFFLRMPRWGHQERPVGRGPPTLGYARRYFRLAMLDVIAAIGECSAGIQVFA